MCWETVNTPETVAGGICTSAGCLIQALSGHSISGFQVPRIISPPGSSSYYVSFGIEEDLGVNKKPKYFFADFSGIEAGLESIQMKYNWVSETHVYVR